MKTNNKLTDDLTNHQKALRKISLQRLFEDDPQRQKRFSLSVAGLFLDYSKNHIVADTIKRLVAYADYRGLPQAITAMFTGESVNNTEQRPALHACLRAHPDDTEKATNEYQSLVSKTIEKMDEFVDAIHCRRWFGFAGQPITTVVNIGIGGSDLGPRMVAKALSAYHQSGIDVHFVANIDGADLSDTLAKFHPQNTLFIIVSKTFTTLETLENARSAKQWLLVNGCKENQLNRHLVAVSANTEKAAAFGIDKQNIFPLWDWVGGRYSLWSAVGLSIALAIGMDNFNTLRRGAAAMDKHYAEAGFKDNMPAILALLTYWYSRYWSVTSQAVLPYAQRLQHLPAYLQQLDMESLGKRVDRQGKLLNDSSGIVLWGAEGTNGQHSFHQLLHQGTQLIPCDFIAVKTPMSAFVDHHRHLLACCISQSQALLKGKTQTDVELELRDSGLDETQIKQLAPHKVIPGNRPSNMLVLDKLDPQNLGALIALYEHKVHALGVLFDINPFDQWGVELGKQLGKSVEQALAGAAIPEQWDNSTRGLIELLRDS